MKIILKSILASLLIMLSSISYAGSCGNETDVFYVNGVSNAPPQARDSLNAIYGAYSSKLATLYPGQTFKFRLAYNHSQTLIPDIIQTITQKFNEDNYKDPYGTPSQIYYSYMSSGYKDMGPAYVSILIDNQTAMHMLEKIDVDAHIALYQAALKANKRVILIAHSQGNLYANKALSLGDLEYNKHMGMIGVAPPSEANVGMNTTYYTASDDKVINLLRHITLNLLKILPPDIEDNSIANYDRDFTLHGFTESYFAPGLPIRKDIDRDFMRLVADIPPVCSIESISTGGPETYFLLSDGRLLVTDGYSLLSYNQRSPKVYDLNFPTTKHGHITQVSLGKGYDFNHATFPIILTDSGNISNFLILQSGQYNSIEYESPWPKQFTGPGVCNGADTPKKWKFVAEGSTFGNWLAIDSDNEVFLHSYADQQIFLGLAPHLVKSYQIVCPYLSPNMQSTSTNMAGEVFKTISLGPDNGIGMTQSGKVYSWGYTNSGALGRDFTNDTFYVPTPVGIDNAKVAEAGGYFAVVLTKDGDIITWGNDTNGQRGDGAGDSSGPAHSKLIVQENGKKVSFKQIAVSHSHVLALDIDGHVWSWGLNLFCQLGNGEKITPNNPNQGVYRDVYDCKDGFVPHLVSGLSDVVDIYAGNSTSFAVTRNGDLYGWGHSHYGELGIPSSDVMQSEYSKPTLITFP